MLKKLFCSFSMLMMVSVLLLSSCSTFNPLGKKLPVVDEMQVLGYEGPEPSIPKMNSDPIPYNGPVIVNMVLVENERNTPVDHQELIINLPEDLKKEFTVQSDHFKSTVTINRAEYTNRDHHRVALLPYLEKPYLVIDGFCRNKVKRGGKVNSRLAYSGGINEISYRSREKYSVFATITPVADIDSIRMMPLEDWMLANDQNWMSYPFSITIPKEIGSPNDCKSLKGCKIPKDWNILKDRELEMIDGPSSRQRGLEMLGLKVIGGLHVSKDATVSLEPVAVDPEGVEGVLSYTHDTQTWTSATDEKILFGDFPGTLAEAVSVVPTNNQGKSDCILQLPDGRRVILYETTSSYFNPLIGKTKESFGYTVYMINEKAEEK
jgi:hypothetical protein